MCPRCHAYLSARSMARNPVWTLRDLWYLRSLEEKGGHQSLSTACVSLSVTHIPRKIKSTLFTHKSSQPSFQIVKLTILYKSQVHPPNLKVKSILLIHLLSHMYLLSSQFHPPYSIVKSTLLPNSQVYHVI